MKLELITKLNNPYSFYDKKNHLSLAKVFEIKIEHLKVAKLAGKITATNGIRPEVDLGNGLTLTKGYVANAHFPYRFNAHDVILEQTLGSGIVGSFAGNIDQGISDDNPKLWEGFATNWPCEVAGKIFYYNGYIAQGKPYSQGFTEKPAQFLFVSELEGSSTSNDENNQTLINSPNSTIPHATKTIMDSIINDSTADPLAPDRLPWEESPLHFLQLVTGQSTFLENNSASNPLIQQLEAANKPASLPSNVTETTKVEELNQRSAATTIAEEEQKNQHEETDQPIILQPKLGQKAKLTATTLNLPQAKEQGTSAIATTSSTKGTPTPVKIPSKLKEMGEFKLTKVLENGNLYGILNVYPAYNFNTTGGMLAGEFDKKHGKLVHGNYIRFFDNGFGHYYTGEAGLNEGKILEGKLTIQTGDQVYKGKMVIPHKFLLNLLATLPIDADKDLVVPLDGLIAEYLHFLASKNLYKGGKLFNEDFQNNLINQLQQKNQDEENLITKEQLGYLVNNYSQISPFALPVLLDGIANQFQMAGNEFLQVEPDEKKKAVVLTGPIKFNVLHGEKCEIGYIRIADIVKPLLLDLNCNKQIAPAKTKEGDFHFGALQGKVLTTYYLLDGTPSKFSAASYHNGKKVSDLNIKYVEES